MILQRQNGRVLAGTALLSAASICRLALQFVIVPILARLLGPTTYGLMSVAMSFVLLANMLSDGGMGAALVRERQHDPELSSTVFWLSFAIGLVLAISICLLSWPIATFYAQPQLAVVLCALAPILILSASISVANAQIVRSQRFELFAAGDLACSVVSAICGVVLALKGAGVWSLVAQQLVLWSTKVAWVGYVVRFHPGLTLRWKLARPLFRFSAGNLAFNVADFAGKSAPVLIVGALLGVGAAGHYSMAFQLTRLADMVIVGPVSLATFSSVAIAQDRMTASSFVLAGWRSLIVSMVPLFIALAFVADPFAPLLLGTRWAGTASILTMLCPGAFIVCLFGFISAALLGRGLAGRTFKLTLAAGIAIATLTLIGARRDSASGALGFSLATLLMLPLYTWSLSTALCLSLRDLFMALGRPILPGMVMLAGMTATGDLSQHLPVGVELLVVIGTGLSAFAATSLLLSASQIIGDFKILWQRIPEEPVPDPEAWPFLPISDWRREARPIGTAGVGSVSTLPTAAADVSGL